MNSWFVHGGFLIVDRGEINVACASVVASLETLSTADGGLR